MRFTILLFLCAFTTQAQNTLFDNVPDNLPTFPPGTIAINDSVYIDNAPVSLIMYKEMSNAVIKGWSYDLILEGKELSFEELKAVPLNDERRFAFYNLIAVGPQEEVDRINEVASTIPVQKLFSMNSPIEHATALQAALYCEWRSNMLYITQKNDRLFDNVSVPRYNYRLPTKDELQRAAVFFEESKKVVNLQFDVKDNSLDKREHTYDNELFYMYSDSISEELRDKSDRETRGLFRCICEISSD
jgi:hypothetical protein